MTNTSRATKTRAYARMRSTNNITTCSCQPVKTTTTSATTTTTCQHRSQILVNYNNNNQKDKRQAMKQTTTKHLFLATVMCILYYLRPASGQCPEKTMTSFEKINGVTIKDAPLTILFSAPNLTATTGSASSTNLYNHHHHHHLLSESSSSSRSAASTAGVYPITAECNNRCRRNPKCRAFLVDYSRHTCWSVEHHHQHQQSVGSSSSSSSGLVRAPTPIHLAPTQERTAYFEKVCLNLPSVDCERAWIFERAIGYHLHGYDDKIIDDVPSRLRCQEHCLNEREFKCRSGEYDYLSMQCRLSAMDRHLKPNLFRPTTTTTTTTTAFASGSSGSSSSLTSSSGSSSQTAITSANSLVDYFENQCVPMGANQQCDSFDRFEDLDLGRPEIMRLFNSSEQCQQYCTHTIKAFICRSFTWSPLTGKCYLNSANSFMVGGLDRLIPAPGLIYYQRNDCIDLKLECDTQAMTLNLRTSEPFRGRMYVRDDPNTCGDTSLAREANGSPSGGLVNSLIIPFHNGGARCAQRELPSRYSSVVVVQQHPLIQRKSDRYIKLVCDFQTANKTITSTYNVVANPWTSTALINATSFAPKIKLRITDRYGQDITGAKLGDELQLRIEAESESVYDMVARSVLAKSGQTDESIVLIDRDGCPADFRIFPPLRKLNKRVIIGKFDAFKFSSDVVVRFQVDVQFCLNVCPPTNCNSQAQQYASTTASQTADQLQSANDQLDGQSMLLNSQQQLTPEAAGVSTTTTSSPALVPNELASGAGSGSGASTQAPLNQLEQFLATNSLLDHQPQTLPTTTNIGRRQTSSRPPGDGHHHYAAAGGDGQTFESMAAPGRHHHSSAGGGPLGRSSDASPHLRQAETGSSIAAAADQPANTIDQSAASADQQHQQNSHRSKKRRRRRAAAEPSPELPRHVPLQREIIVIEGPSTSTNSAKEQQVANNNNKSRRDGRQQQQQQQQQPKIQTGTTGNNNNNNIRPTDEQQQQQQQQFIAGQQEYYSTLPVDNNHLKEPLLCTTWNSLVFSILAFCALQLLTIGLCMATCLHRHKKKQSSSFVAVAAAAAASPSRLLNLNLKQQQPHLLQTAGQQQTTSPNTNTRRQSNTFMHQQLDANCGRLY